jgi:hypothetical protein
MVTTRRQSGTVSKVEASKALTDYASDMDEDLSEESEEEANYKRMYLQPSLSYCLLNWDLV